MSAGAGFAARVEEAAWRCADLLLGAPDVMVLPEPDWKARALAEGALRRRLDWRNTVVRTPDFTRLHVEYFAIPGEIAVLHLCAFPRLGAALPILGFDVIAGQQRATGCFLDLSPTVPQAEPAIAAWAAHIASARAGLGELRVLPDWATIFSPHAVAVRPRDAAALEARLALGEASLLGLLRAGPAALADPTAMRTAQLRYIAGQRSNDRTRRMLAACIGPTLAEEFIETCLFPAPGAASPPGLATAA
jgi:phycocyanobilin:ferredoxin oxidoreductase